MLGAQAALLPDLRDAQQSRGEAICLGGAVPHAPPVEDVGAVVLQKAVAVAIPAFGESAGAGAEMVLEEDPDLELPELVALLGMLFSQEDEFAPDDARQAAALAKILSDESVGRVYVAREAGRIVAMASLLYSISTAEGGLCASFEDLIVLPERRGRGIGSALLAFVIEQARRQGVLRITLLTDAGNRRAQALYARAGFASSGMLPMRLHLKGERE